MRLKNGIQSLFSKKEEKAGKKRIHICPYCDYSWEAEEDFSYCPICGARIQAEPETPDHIEKEGKTESE